MEAFSYSLKDGNSEGSWGEGGGAEQERIEGKKVGGICQNLCNEELGGRLGRQVAEARVECLPSRREPRIPPPLPRNNPEASKQRQNKPLKYPGQRGKGTLERQAGWTS